MANTSPKQIANLKTKRSMDINQKKKIYQIAKELNHSNESIIEYLSEQGYTGLTLMSFVPNEMINSIRFHFLMNRNTKIEMKKNDTFFGIVKWFGNKQTNRSEGFIVSFYLGREIFVKLEDLSCQTIVKDDFVVFKLINSKKSFHAINVQRIADIKEIRILLKYFLHSLFQETQSTPSHHTISDNIKNSLISKDRNEISRIIFDNFEILLSEYNNYPYDNLVDYFTKVFVAIKEINRVEDNILKVIIKKLFIALDPYLRIKLWLKNIGEAITIDIIIDQINNLTIKDLQEIKLKMDKEWNTWQNNATTDFTLMFEKCLLEHQIIEESNAFERVLLLFHICYNDKKNIPDNLKDCFYNRCGQEFKFKLWEEEWVRLDLISLYTYIIQAFWNCSLTVQFRIINECSIPDKESLINSIFKPSILQGKVIPLSIIQEYLTNPALQGVCTQTIFTHILEHRTIEDIFQLWIEDHLKGNPDRVIDYISEFIISFDFLIIDRIMQKFQNKERYLILANSLKKIGTIDNDANFQKSSKLLDISKTYLTLFLPNIILQLREQAVLRYRYQFWMDYNIDEFEMEYLSKILPTLQIQEQRKFIKRLFNLIHSGASNITFEIIKNNVQITDPRIDISTRIVIKTINEFAAKSVKTKYKDLLYEILSLVQDPQNLQSMTGYFEMCLGRGKSPQTVKGIQGKNIVVNVVRIDIPLHVDYCEGQLANKLDTQHQCEFYWCRNEPCYLSVQVSHIGQDWKEYTLRDFFEILHIEYQIDQYYQFLGLLNKINRFIEHLSCFECKKILHPVGSSRFGFWRVNTFHCTNRNCVISQKNEIIYLTHCLNPKCDNIIDNRNNNAKCLTTNKVSGGWYVCDYCFACCKQDKIQARSARLGVHTEEETGHHDIGVISCYKCGNKMVVSIRDNFRYNEMLNKFKKNNLNNATISKTGSNGTNNWYIITRKQNISLADFESKLKELKKIGFEVLPKDPQYDENSRLVIENGQYLFCSNSDCDIEIDLKHLDPTKKKALKYHTLIEDILQQMQ